MQFKVALTNFVKSFPDEPLAPGYSRQNGNSLLDLSGDKTVSILSGRSTSSMTGDPIEDSMKPNKVKK